MSDQSDVPATEPEEAAQDAANGSASPPWGDDFDAQRAWDTIQKLRGFEKQAKEFERLQNDESYRDEWVRNHYSLVDDEEQPNSDEEDDDLEFEDDDRLKPVTEKLSALEKWQQEREQERIATQIRTDLNEINDGSEWDLDDIDRQRIVAVAAQDPKGFNRDSLARAHKAYIDRLEAAANRGVERAKDPKKPKPPHNLPGGSAATQVPDLNNQQERHRWLQEQVASRSAQ